MGVKVIDGKQQLTEKQERFCIEYVLNKGNATEAAYRAGYSDSTETVIGSIAWENRQASQIRKIQRLQFLEGDLYNFWRKLG